MPLQRNFVPQHGLQRCLCSAAEQRSPCNLNYISNMKSEAAWMTSCHILRSFAGLRSVGMECRTHVGSRRTMDCGAFLLTGTEFRAESIPA